jgi:hypothetical protein
MEVSLRPELELLEGDLSSCTMVSQLGAGRPTWGKRLACYKQVKSKGIYTKSVVDSANERTVTSKSVSNSYEGVATG